ncbi:MAG: ABC transporter ATP-binding protein [Spirochaetia bacterium]
MKTGKLKLLWKFMAGYKLLYLAAMGAVAIATLAGFVVPLVLRLTIDSALGGMPIDLPEFAVRMIDSVISMDHLRTHLWIAAAVIVGVTTVAGVFQFYQKKWSAVASERTAQRIREDLYDHLQHLSYDYHVKAETGDLIQRSTSDVETVRRFMAVQSVEVGRAAILLATAYPLLFGLHVRLALLSVPIVIVIFVFSLVFFKRMQRAFKASDEAEGRLSTVLQENLTGIRVVRAFARQKHEAEKFAKRNEEFRDLTWKLMKLFAGFWSISDLLAMGHMCAILLAGTWFAVQGGLSIGDMVVFLTVEGMLLWPVRQLGRILADMGKASVALGRIDEILQEPIEYPPEPAGKPAIAGRVVFKDVHFAYGDDREILKGISFTAEPGMTVAILGPTGSGKSSLVHLLSRLYDYTDGSVTVDGVELREIDKKWIRSHIGFVLQEPFLYAKTVKENIGLAGRTTTDAVVFEAARDAAIHHDIERFDKGYETLVGERGVTLSGGQKQRVAIARALITGNPILVFDDSLSAVDTETDVAIRRALLKRSKNATTFIISHRVTTLSSADLILVLDDGRIVQSGTHEALMRQDGLYKRVWGIQNSLEDDLKTDLQKELSIEHV